MVDAEENVCSQQDGPRVASLFCDFMRNPWR